MFTKIKGGVQTFRKKQRDRKIDFFAKQYFAENRLHALIEVADKLSGSRGPQVNDYVLLHSLIRQKRPAFVLECGTGKSTWVIADALSRNHTEFGVKGKVISMENVKKWYDEAISIFPEHLKPFAEIHLSPRATYMHAFIKGTVYENVPQHPYEIVFVDGPDYTITENGKENITANMDFIRLLYTSETPITAVVDYRLNSVIAFGILLGKKKVKFLKPWNVGVIENVTKKDLLQEDKPNTIAVLEALNNVADIKYEEPAWIKL